MAKILALDIGEKRIGVATADINAPFPAPLTTLEASPTLASDFAAIVKKQDVRAVVIGLPRNQQGERTKQTDRVEHIAKLLKIPETVAVHWQDESLTSVKAEAELEKRKKPYKKADVDALAATYILSDYITAHRSELAQLSSIPSAQDSPKHSVHKSSKKTSKKQKKTPKKAKPPRTTAQKMVRVLFATVGLLTIAAVAAISWYLYALTPLTTDENYSVITVEEGDSISAIAARLEEKSVIRSATAFSLYIRLSGSSDLKAGEFRVSSKQSTQDIVQIIANGKVTTVNILIAPGLRLDEIIDTLVTNGFSEQEITTALAQVRDHPALDGAPADAPLEGYFFPDTYQVSPSTSAQQLLETMLDTFSQRVVEDNEIIEGIENQGLSLAQAVILASIVQKEVPDYETQQKVAQVFIKRFKIDMPLGADPTFKYAAALTGAPATPNIDSPYNTRKVVGLPPSAISNFNLSAIKAVANPSTTDHTYFVSGDDGITYFSNTLEEHEALTREHCIQLCSQ